MINYGEELKVIRKKLGLKLEFMAKKLNVAKSTLSNYENGAREMTVEFYDKALQEYNGIANYENKTSMSLTPIETFVNSIKAKIGAKNTLDMCTDNISVKDGANMESNNTLREELLKDGWVERHLWGNLREYLKNIQTKNGEMIMVTFNTISDYIFIVKDIENQNRYVSVEDFLAYEKNPKYCLEYGENNEQTLWDEIVYWENEPVLTDDTIFNKDTNNYLLNIHRKFIQQV